MILNSFTTNFKLGIKKTFMFEQCIMKGWELMSSA